MPSSDQLAAAEQAVEVGAVVAGRVGLAAEPGDGTLELVDVEAADVALGHLAGTRDAVELHLVDGSVGLSPRVELSQVMGCPHGLRVDGLVGGVELHHRVAGLLLEGLRARQS